MNKFVFKLEPLFNYRKRLEEICQKEFGEALKRLDDEEIKLDGLKESYRASAAELDRMRETSAEAHELCLYSEYFKGLKSHIEEQEAVIKGARAALETRRGELMEAARNKKVVKTIKERSYGHYIEGLNKEDQKTTDDLVNSRFKRSGNNEV